MVARERIGACALGDPHIDGGASRRLRGSAECCERRCAEVWFGVERIVIGVASPSPQPALARVAVRGQLSSYLASGGGAGDGGGCCGGGKLLVDAVRALGDPSIDAA